LRFGDRRVLALMHTLCLFALSPTGFRHREVRAAVTELLGRNAEPCAASQMTYDLRRLRLHGLIERVPDSHRYRITDRGAKYRDALRAPPCTRLSPSGIASDHGICPRPACIRTTQAALTTFLQEVRLVA
jgi:hypothetical protein